MMALGADCTSVGTAAIIAGGCIACMQCHVGTCPVGIATQDPEHEARYDLDRQAENMHRYFESLALANCRDYQGTRITTMCTRSTAAIWSR